MHSTVWNVPVKYTYIPPEEFAKLPVPIAVARAELFDFIHRFGYSGEKVNGRGILGSFVRMQSLLYGFTLTAADMFDGKKLCPNLSTFEQWLAKNYPSPPTTTSSAH